MEATLTISESGKQAEVKSIYGEKYTVLAVSHSNGVKYLQVSPNDSPSNWYLMNRNGVDCGRPIGKWKARKIVKADRNAIDSLMQ